MDFTSPSYPPLDPIGRQGTKNTKTAVKAIKTRFSSNFFDFPHRKPKTGFFYHSGGGAFFSTGKKFEMSGYYPTVQCPLVGYTGNFWSPMHREAEGLDKLFMVDN